MATKVCFVLPTFNFISSSHMACQHYHHWVFPIRAVYSCSTAPDSDKVAENATG